MRLDYRYKFSADIVSGKLVFKQGQRESLANVLSKQADQEVEIVLQTPEKDRSDRQRKYYYGVIVKRLCEATGYEKDDMSEILAKSLLSFDLTLKDGHVESFYRRPSSLNTAETETYHERCRQYANDKHQLYIPLPNEVEGQYDYY